MLPDPAKDTHPRRSRDAIRILFFKKIPILRTQTVGQSEFNFVWTDPGWFIYQLEFRI